MNNRKDTNRINIRKNAGLPDDNGKIAGLVSEDPYEICENTIGYSRSHKALSSLHTPSSSFHLSQNKAKSFDYGASGGATSPNTEVNADGQGIASEVPRKTAK